MDREKMGSSPFDRAEEVRQEIVEAMALGAPFEVVISPSEFACLQRVPGDILDRHGLSILIHTTKDGVHILATRSQKIAMEAFRNWQADQSEEAAIPFKQSQYVGLYGLIQGVREEQGEQVIKGIGGLFLRLLEEEDERLSGSYDLIVKQGLIPDKELEILHAYLQSMWDALPQEIQWSINQYHYSNLF
jgi:hypothetical protein